MPFSLGNFRRRLIKEVLDPGLLRERFRPIPHQAGETQIRRNPEREEDVVANIEVRHQFEGLEHQPNVEKPESSPGGGAATAEPRARFATRITQHR